MNHHESECNQDTRRADPVSSVVRPRLGRAREARQLCPNRPLGGRWRRQTGRWPGCSGQRFHPAAQLGAREPAVCGLHGELPGHPSGLARVGHPVLPDGQRSGDADLDGTVGRVVSRRGLPSGGPLGCVRGRWGDPGQRELRITDLRLAECRGKHCRADQRRTGRGRNELRSDLA